ncbi:protein kinase [Streptomyces mutabilis]|uniref:protein kinase domain-containing protein n=1 Tax=Streptomyces mutabilis TaxID=67332 RepID=UPI00365E6D73
MEVQDRLVGQRYRLVERVGPGGAGRVWRAFDEAAGREVAVERPVLPGDPADEAYRRAAHRLTREARAAARVDHPAAVRIHDVVEETAGDGGPPWIVMEWVGGESLHEALRRGPVPAPEAARVGHAVLGALRAAHSVGIVHRGVSAGRVLLGPHGRVVLTGFGTAHVPGEEIPRGRTRRERPPRSRVPGVGPSRGPAAGEESLPGGGPAADLRALGTLLRTAVAEQPAAGPLGPLVERLLAADDGRRPNAGAIADEVAQEVAQGLAEVAGGLRPAPPRNQGVSCNPSA